MASRDPRLQTTELPIDHIIWLTWCRHCYYIDHRNVPIRDNTFAASPAGVRAGVTLEHHPDCLYPVALAAQEAADGT